MNSRFLYSLPTLSPKPTALQLSIPLHTHCNPKLLVTLFSLVKTMTLLCPFANPLLYLPTSAVLPAYISTFRSYLPLVRSLPRHSYSPHDRPLYPICIHFPLLHASILFECSPFQSVPLSPVSKGRSNTSFKHRLGPAKSIYL